MKLQGQAQLQARLRAIGQTQVMLRDIQIHGVREAKLLVPRKTGNLGRTIRVGTVTNTTASIYAGGTASVGYAAYVEFGTRPHIIRPRNAKVLAWGGDRRLSGALRSGAKPTNFAMIVHHPGTRAHPFLVPGLQKAASQAGTDAIIRQWNGAA